MAMATSLHGYDHHGCMACKGAQPLRGALVDGGMGPLAQIGSISPYSRYPCPVAAGPHFHLLAVHVGRNQGPAQKGRTGLCTLHLPGGIPPPDYVTHMLRCDANVVLLHRPLLFLRVHGAKWQSGQSLSRTAQPLVAPATIIIQWLKCASRRMNRRSPQWPRTNHGGLQLPWLIIQRAYSGAQTQHHRVD